MGMCVHVPLIDGAWPLVSVAMETIIFFFINLNAGRSCLRCATRSRRLSARRTRSASAKLGARRRASPSRRSNQPRRSPRRSSTRTPLRRRQRRRKLHPLRLLRNSSTYRRHPCHRRQRRANTISNNNNNNNSSSRRPRRRRRHLAVTLESWSSSAALRGDCASTIPTKSRFFFNNF